MAVRKRPTTSGFSFLGRPGGRRPDPPPACAHKGSRRAISAQRYKSAASLREGRLGRRRATRGLVGGWAWLLTPESCAVCLIGPMAFGESAAGGGPCPACGFLVTSAILASYTSGSPQ